MFNTIIWLLVGKIFDWNYDWNTIFKAFDKYKVLLFIPLSFHFIGIYALYRAIKKTLAWQKFGTAPLTLDTFPGQLGGLVAGYVDLPVAYDKKHQAKVTLRCKHHYRSSRDETATTFDVIWDDRIPVRTQYSSLGSRIHFSFNPPARLPESQPESSLGNRESYKWEIHMQLSLPGHDFDHKFIIPVTHVSEYTIAASAKQTAITVIPDEVEASNIPLIRQYSKGTHFYYPAFRRNKLLGFGLMIPLAVSWLLLRLEHQEFSDTTFIGMLVPAILGFALMLRSLTVDMNNQSVNIKHKVLGFPFYTKQILISDIADIKTVWSGVVVNEIHSYYNLKLIQMDGSRSAIGDSLDGQRYAESIRKQVINSLGAGWKVN